jgi:hypothetical protein
LEVKYPFVGKKRKKNRRKKEEANTQIMAGYSF